MNEVKYFLRVKNHGMMCKVMTEYPEISIIRPLHTQNLLYVSTTLGDFEKFYDVKIEEEVMLSMLGEGGQQLVINDWKITGIPKARGLLESIVAEVIVERRNYLEM